jgi:hypothetical protein
VTITESACDALKVHPARPFLTIAVLIFYLCVGSCSLSVIARASEDVQFGDPDGADSAAPSAVGASQPPSPLHFSGSDATAIETTADHERDSASAVPGRGELGERQFADWSQQRRWPPRGMMPHSCRGAAQAVATVWFWTVAAAHSGRDSAKARRGSRREAHADGIS